jgi:hypothetical protein
MDVDGQVTVIAGTGSGDVVSWDLRATDPVPRSLTSHTKAVTSLSCRAMASEPYVVSASTDDVRMTSLRSGHDDDHVGMQLVDADRADRVLAMSETGMVAVPPDSSLPAESAWRTLRLDIPGA